MYGKHIIDQVYDTYYFTMTVIIKTCNMRPPHNASGIEKPWVEYFLTQYESKANNNAKVIVNKFSFKSATKPGESFNAELVMLDVEATLTRTNQSTGDETIDTEYHLIVKFLSQDPFSREMIKKTEYHLRELMIYSEIAEKLNNFQQQKIGENKYPLHLPKFIYGKCTRRDYVLVMENLKSTGYETCSKETGLGIEELKLALSQAARLHAISAAYDKEHKLLENYPCFKFNSNISVLFKPVVYSSLDNAIKFLHLKEEHKDIVSKLESGRLKLPAKFSALWDDQSRHKYLSLTHGDFWNSNLLYHYTESENGRALDSLRVIDWQISMWNNPVMDLHYLFNTSTTRSIRDNHKVELLQHYYHIFSEVTLAFEPQAPHESFEEFKAEFDRLSIVGFLMGVCLTQGTLSKAGELINRQDSGNSTGVFSRIKQQIRSTTAKIVVPLAFQPSSHWIIKAAIKKKLDPIGKELISQENELMNGRLLDLILEAEDSGLLDVMNL